MIFSSTLMVLEAIAPNQKKDRKNEGNHQKVVTKEGTFTPLASAAFNDVDFAFVSTSTDMSLFKTLHP